MRTAGTLHPARKGTHSAAVAGAARPWVDRRRRRALHPVSGERDTLSSDYPCQKHISGLEIWTHRRDEDGSWTRGGDAAERVPLPSHSEAGTVSLDTTLCGGELSPYTR